MKNANNKDLRKSKEQISLRNKMQTIMRITIKVNNKNSKNNRRKKDKKMMNLLKI